MDYHLKMPVDNDTIKKLKVGDILYVSTTYPKNLSNVNESN